MCKFVGLLLSRKLVDNQCLSFGERMNYRGKFGIVAAVVLFLGIVCASNVVKAQAIEVGVTGGLSSYYGDINPIKPFNEGRVGFGGLLRYYQSSRWAFRFSYLNRKVMATDKQVNIRPERELGFKCDINDFALVTEFNFLDYTTGSKRSNISPYLFVGVSFVMFNPKALDGTELCNVLTDVDGYKEVDGEDVNNIENGTAKYKKYTLAIPFGFGLKYGLGKRFCLSAEWRIDWTWTDWIDDCRGYYPLWENGDAWAQYADPSGNVALDGENNVIKYLQRGDSAKYDFLSILSLTVAFKFNLPENKKCDVGLGRNAYIYY